jgi:hypothetical protein
MDSVYLFITFLSTYHTLIKSQVFTKEREGYVFLRDNRRKRQG